MNKQEILLISVCLGILCILTAGFLWENYLKPPFEVVEWRYGTFYEYDYIFVRIKYTGRESGTISGIEPHMNVEYIVEPNQAFTVRTQRGSDTIHFTFNGEWTSIKFR